jgi:hypothetical protein
MEKAKVVEEKKEDKRRKKKALAPLAVSWIRP